MRKYCNYCGMEVEFTEYKGDEYAVLWGNSHAVLWGNSHAVLWGNSHAVLWENSHAVLWGNSHAVLWENSHAELWENSHAVLRGNSHAELRGNSHAQCKSPYACGILKSIASQCTGNHIGDKSISPREYLKRCTVQIKGQYAILYKSVRPNLTNGRNGLFQYQIGVEVIALDWDADYKEECGKGLHLSPTAKQAASFYDSQTYLACKVKIKDIASLPAFAEYPDKIRVRACTPLYRCDIEGKEIKEEIKKED
jgi:hypothetical protein